MCFMFSVFIQTRSYTKVDTRHVKLRFLNTLRENKPKTTKLPVSHKIVTRTLGFPRGPTPRLVKERNN